MERHLPTTDARVSDPRATRHATPGHVPAGHVPPGYRQRASAFALRARSLFALVAAATILGGCASVAPVVGHTDFTGDSMQSETSATTSYSGEYRVVVSFNDETGNAGKVIYTPTTRKILQGASLLGWSYSGDKGRTWTYGGKLAPPAGWSALWGDPAMTTSGAAYNVVFISSLAMPNGKFPAGGIDGYVTYGSKGAYIGGACIARSTNGGVSFQNYQCVANKESDAGDPDAVKGHFYDGGSMASTPSGEVFAAYVDVTKGRIDVWRAPTHDGVFERIGDPFPGMVAATHPRLRATPEGFLYAATTIVNNPGYVVFVNRFRDGAWGKPVQASESAAVYPKVDLGSVVQGSPLAIRTGPQFSFDIGAASEGGNDAVRFLYTRRSGERLFVEGSACPFDLRQCFPVPEWRAGSGSAEATAYDAFNPTVSAWRGFIGLPPHWTSSFYSRYGQSVGTVSLARMNLAYVNGAPLGIPVTLAKNIAVCSDTRGYWGDYDDMLHVGFDDTTPVFVRFTTSDLGKGCDKRWIFVARHQHVQAVREPE